MRVLLRHSRHRGNVDWRGSARTGKWEVEGRELEAQQQLAAVTTEREDLKSKLQLQQEDSVQVVGALLRLFVIMYLH